MFRGRGSYLQGLLGVLGALALSASSFAMPASLNYAGRLTHEDGRPVAGPVDLRIVFYPSATATTPLGVAPYIFKKVTLADGLFQVSLALSASDLNVLFPHSGGSPYIEVTDTTHKKTFARQAFGFVPYAMKVPVDDETISFDESGRLTILSSRAAGEALVSTINKSATGSIDATLLPPLGGDLQGGIDAAVVNRLRGRPLADQAPQLGEVLAWSGSAWTPVAVSGGGPLGANAVTTATIAAGAITDDKIATGIDAGKITHGVLPAAQIPALDAAKIGSGVLDGARIPNLDAAKITTGTIGVAVGGTGANTAAGARTNLGAAAAGVNTDITSLGSLQSLAASAQTAADTPIVVRAHTGQTADLQQWQDSSGQALAGIEHDGTLKLKDGDGTANYLRLRAPATMASDVSFTFPASIVAGQYLTSDGSGNLSWAAPSGAGDITEVVAGAGLTGGASSGAATLAVDVGTTANKIVQLDASARLPAVDGSQLLNVGDITDVVAGTGLTGGAASGSAALAVDVGTTANKIVQLDAAAKLPAVDGSALTNVVTAATVEAADAVMDGDFASNGLLVRSGAGTYATISDQSTQWNTAYSDRLKWDGSAGALNPATGRASLELGSAASFNAGSGANDLVQLDAAGKLPAVDASALTNITIPWATPGAIGSTTPASGRFTSVTANTGVQMKDGDGVDHFVVLRAPTNLSTDVVFTLPATAVAGQFLTTDASGHLSWSAPSGSGDITEVIAGTGLTGGASAGAATLAVDVGTTANKIVQLDAAGKLPAVDASALTNITIPWASPGAIGSTTPAAGSFTALSSTSGLALKDTGTFAVTVKAPAVLGANATYTLPPAPVAGQYLTTDASGVLSWSAVSGGGGGGSITEVIAGNGLSGGATSGAATLNIAAGGVGTSELASGAVTAAKLASDAAVDANRAVSSNHIRELAVTSGKLSDNAVTTAKILDANVTSAKIADGAVSSVKIADSAVSSAKIADSAVSSAKIGDGAVTSAKLGGDAVTTVKIADSNVTTAKIAANAVDTAKINDSAVTSAKIADGTIVNADISAAAAIADSKLATITTAGKVSGAAITSGAIGGSTSFDSTGSLASSGNVIVKATGAAATELRFQDNDNSHYVAFKSPTTVSTNTVWVLPASDGSSGQALVTNGTGGLGWAGSLPPSGTAGGDLTGSYPNPTVANSAITAAKLATDAVTTVKIAANAVDTAKINDSAVTSAKIADNNVTTAKIATGAVTSNEIANGTIANVDVSATAAITRDKLASGTLSHVLINDASGVMSSEAQLALSRGGTGANGSSLAANLVFASPAASSGAASYRALAATDIPTLTVAKLSDFTSAVDTRITTKNGWALDGNGGSPANAVYVTSGGLVGIGTTSPTAKMDVAGQIRGSSFTAAANATTFNFNNGNNQASVHSAAGSGTVALTLSNLLSGGVYTLALQSTQGATYTFSGSGMTYKFLPANAATVSGKDVVYTITPVGTTAYVTWMSGF